MKKVDTQLHYSFFDKLIYSFISLTDKRCFVLSKNIKFGINVAYVVLIQLRIKNFVLLKPHIGYKEKIKQEKVSTKAN